MTERDKILNDVKSLSSINTLLELPTGTGKTRAAIEMTVSRIKRPCSILIVVPRLVLIDSWKEEFKKWGYAEWVPWLQFITYVSLPKINGHFKMLIADEVHHMSQRCLDALEYIKYDNAILLSATVSVKKKIQLQSYFNDLRVYKRTLKSAIDTKILPDPQVYLIPLHLNTSIRNCLYVKNPKKGNPIQITYDRRFNYIGMKGRRIEYKCTQREYYDELSTLIEWYKKKAMYGNEVMKNMWLHKCNDRLKWLSEQKTTIVSQILKELANYRTLTFCSSIEQSELLGKHNITSKNDDAVKNLNAFNNKKIKHITACNMLDEGANLTDCQIGIYASLSASDRLIYQRGGRILRHKNPIFIIPYFIGTRDVEILDKMKENYNPELVKTITIEELYESIKKTRSK